MYNLYLTCPRGLEEALHKEIQSEITQPISIENGGVSFKGDIKDIYRINYITRIGMNLHVELFADNISNYNNLYDSIYKYNWNNIISPANTFAIKTKIQSDILHPSIIPFIIFFILERSILPIAM